MFKDRITTSFGLDIATGLAMESIFEPTEDRYDPERVIPNKVDFNKHNNLIINGFTLIRNIINSHPDRPNVLWLLKEGKKHLDNLKAVFEEEVHILQSLVSMYPKGKLYILFPKYMTAYARYNKKKEQELGYITNTINLINLTLNIINNSNVNDKFLLTQDHKLPMIFNNPNTILLTHLTMDLVENKHIWLLESHTGVMKNEVEFYTKFSPYGKNSLIRIPLTPTTLFILGDHTLVKSLGLKSKRLLLEVANEEKWTYRTNELTVKNKLLKTELADELKGNIY